MNSTSGDSLPQSNGVSASKKQQKRVYQPFVVEPYSRKKYNRNCIIEFVTSTADDDSKASQRKQSYLLTGSEVVKQWIITGTTLRCVNTFKIGVYQKDLNVTVADNTEVISPAQVNEDVFVGQCEPRHSWSIKCVQFWNIKKPSDPFLVLDGAQLMCALRHTRYNKVALKFYPRTDFHIDLYSLDDGSTKKLINDTWHEMVTLCEKGDGVLVSINENRDMRWWDPETGACLMKYSKHLSRTLDLIVIDNDQLFLWSLYGFGYRIHCCGRPDELDDMEPSETYWKIDKPTKILSVASRTSGGLIVSSDDRLMRIYDSNMNQVVLCGTFKTSKTHSVCEMSDGSVAGLTENGTIAVWKITPPK